jgi:thiosulfate/3-mercaptopyruvate sulfurtransferase
MVIADCRFLLGDPAKGRKAYEEGHLPGAIYVDLEQDLSAPVGKHGGRHPIPDEHTLAERLGSLGMDRSTVVVAYDDQGGMMASRLWWILHYLGHDQAYVLNGGLSAWVQAGYPLVHEVPQRKARTFVPETRSGILVDANHVKARLGNSRTLLIDSREPKRYLGQEEPIDAIAGHIPGAVNAFWRNVLTDDGVWRNAEELKQLFSFAEPYEEVIVYCGSGVSACPNFLSLKEAGYEEVKLYAGSLSDWISYPDHPIATGAETDKPAE